MPVFRYRDISEMADVWRDPGDPALFRAIARLWEMSAALAPCRYPPGVYRARDVEQSNRLGEQWNVTNVRQLRARRGQAPGTTSGSTSG
jgi:hypothetical protein